MKLNELKPWRKKYKKVHGKDARKMKGVARSFRDKFNLQHLKGAQLFSLLRDDWNVVIPLLDKIAPSTPDDEVDKIPMALATVTSGEHEGKNVCILAKFTDGDYLCEFYNKETEDNYFKLIDKKRLRLWVSVESVNSPKDKR